MITAQTLVVSLVGIVLPGQPGTLIGGSAKLETPETGLPGCVNIADMYLPTFSLLTASKEIKMDSGLH